MINIRGKIIRSAAELLAQGGREAVSTRAVAAAAGVQVPTIYRHFGDMRDLLDAVTSYGFASYLSEEISRKQIEDPVEDLRHGWNLHVAFGLANPAFYTLMYGDPQTASESTAASQAFEVLYAHVQRIAEAGRLRVGITRATQMIQAAGCGVTLTLLELKPEVRDITLSDQIREVILKAVTVSVDADTTARAGASEVQSRAISHAIALRALLPEISALTPGERALLTEWLDRLSQAESSARHE